MSGKIRSAVNESVALSIYTLPDCQPCELLKEALDDSAFAAFRPIAVHTLGIEEVRLLRKRMGTRLVFPILLVMQGSTVLARRLGVTPGADASSERAEILCWMERLNESRG